MPSRIAIIASVTIVFAMFSGCGGVRRTEWKIDVHNQSASPCSVRVGTGYVNNSGQGTSEAHVDDMKAGDMLTLISGTRVTTIRSIKVVRTGDEQTLTPAIEIQPGQRYRIVVPAEGPAEASFDTKKL